jgi:sec-independent protein translocase protein TatA
MLFGKIGPLEVVIVLAVILLIFGPTKLPGLARAIGKSVVELKDGLKGKSASGSDESSSSAAENNK